MASSKGSGSPLSVGKPSWKPITQPNKVKSSSGVAGGKYARKEDLGPLGLAKTLAAKQHGGDR